MVEPPEEWWDFDGAWRAAHAAGETDWSDWKRRRQEEAARHNGRILARAPVGTTGVIVAAFEVNEWPPNTDSYWYRDTRPMIIGWSKTSRLSYAELRKAAATFPPTAHLADKACECRERYWFCGGDVLKAPGRLLNDGWIVKRYDFDRFEGGLILYGDGLPDAPKEPGGGA